MADIKQFFDDYLNPKKIIELKNDYKELTTRAGTLPPDYEYVFNQISQYMWMYAKGNGKEIMHIQERLLDTFERAAAEGKRVLQVTGNDVAAYADSLLQEAGITPYDPRKHLNNEIHAKLAKDGRLS